MQKSTRAVDVGGNGARRADVRGTEVSNYTAVGFGEITTPNQLLAFAIDNLPGDNDSIAFTVAGDISNGVVIKSPQMRWLDGYNLAGRTRALYVKAAIAINDMDGAGIGMAKMLLGHNLFRAMTWSSGIGDRIVVNGQILTKSEAGHCIVDHSANASLCGCGKRGCLEAVIGGEAVKHWVLKYAHEAGIEIPLDVATKKPMHPCKFLDLQYKADVGGAVAIYGEIAKIMGRHLAYLQNAVFVPLIVWKGTFAISALPLIEDIIRHYMRADLMNPGWEKEMKFMISPDPQNDSLIGAAEFLRATYR